MSQSNALTKNPTLLTAILSAATVAGYIAYRLTLGGTEPAPADMTDMTEPGHEMHGAMGAMADENALPDVALNTLDGTPTSLTAYAGRALVINFWATWCAPCLREIPMLKDFHDTHAGIDVIGIAVDRIDPVLEYAADMEFNYPVLIGPSGPAEGMDVMGTFENIAGAMPFSVFVSAEGAMLGRHAGELHPEHLEAVASAIDALAAGEVDLATARTLIAAQF